MFVSWIDAGSGDFRLGLWNDPWKNRRIDLKAMTRDVFDKVNKITNYEIKKHSILNTKR